MIRIEPAIVYNDSGAGERSATRQPEQPGRGGWSVYH
jgi:hypothetical protein